VVRETVRLDWFVVFEPDRERETIQVHTATMIGFFFQRERIWCSRLYALFCGQHWLVGWRTMGVLWECSWPHCSSEGSIKWVKPESVVVGEDVEAQVQKW